MLIVMLVSLNIQQGKPHQLASVEGNIIAVDPNPNEYTVSIIPSNGTETDAVVFNVTDQTEITLDGGDASIEDLDELEEEENSVIAIYYVDSREAVRIDADSLNGDS